MYVVVSLEKKKKKKNSFYQLMKSRGATKVLLPREQKDFMTNGITNLLGPLHGYLIYFFMGSISSRIEYYVKKMNNFFFFFLLIT
jgi:hypothetical protein